jgi:hypothetical protein
MTIQEYKNTLICFLCSYGKTISKFNNKLRVGNWCAESQEKLEVLKRLFDMYSKFDTRDLLEGFGTYDIYTEEELMELIKQIEELI